MNIYPIFVFFSNASREFEDTRFDFFWVIEHNIYNEGNGMSALDRYPRKKLREIELLGSISSVLSWDQQTNMPSNGARAASSGAAWTANEPTTSKNYR